MRTIFFIVCSSLLVHAGGYDESYRLLGNILAIGNGTNAVYRERDMEIVKIDIDLIGKGIPKQVVKKLSGDFTYTIFCLGDPERIKDINIKVYYIIPGGGTLEVAKDDRADPTAEVRLENPTPGDYIIFVDAFEMQSGVTMGYFYLCVAHN
jgi:hypothetical protein